MREALQYVTWAIGLTLNLLVIATLLRGVYRAYPFTLVYSAAVLLSTVVEIAAQSFPRSVQDTYYWIDEAVIDFLVFCVVIAFIDHASRRSPKKTIPRAWLILAAVLILFASVALHHSPHLNRQMTLISRDLNICAVVLDLVLWSLLVTARHPDRTLLLLSGGLGMQLTGAIMGEQLRNVSHRLYTAGTLLEVITGLFGTYIWWRALKEVPAPERGPIKKGGVPQEPTRY